MEMVEGYKKRKKQTFDELLYLAWHTEAFARMKKLPSLKSLIKGEKRQQTDEEMLAMCKMLNAAYGGEFIEEH